MSIHIYFSNNSVRNTTLACDSLGIHYTVSKPTRIISLARWNSKVGKDVIVGEFELPFFRKDQIRVGASGQWQDMRDFLHAGRGYFSNPLSFTADNGMQYTWKTQGRELIMTHQSGDGALVTYHRNISSPSYLEISDSSILSGIDTIILTFLIAERKRRDRQKRRRRRMGAIAHSGG